MGKALSLTERLAAAVLLVLAVVMGCATVAASMEHGAPSAGDEAIHSAISLETWTTLVQRGRFFDWSYLYGLGSPLYAFRPPGFYAVVQMIHLAALGQMPLLDAEKLAYAIGFSLYPAAVFYLLLKFRFSLLTCGLGALLALGPISTFGHTVDAYYDLGLAKQLFAILLFPVALGKLHGIVARGERLFPGAILFGMIFINHPYLAWSFALVAGLYLLMEVWAGGHARGAVRAAAKTGGVIVLGTLLSAFWLVPFYTSDEIQPVQPFSSAFRHGFDVRTETAAAVTDHYLRGSLLDRTTSASEAFGKGSIWMWRDNSNGKRWPVLSWMSLLGLAMLLVRRPTRSRAFFAAGWVACFLVFLGPDDLPVLRLIPLQKHFQYAHFVVVLELFAICLAAVGIAGCAEAAWGLARKRLAALHASSARSCAAYALIVALIAGIFAGPVLAERYGYGRQKIRNRRFEVGPAGQTAWSLATPGNRAIQDALAYLRGHLAPFERVYAAPADIHSGVEVFHFTLAPAYLGHGDLVSPLLVGTQGGANDLLNNTDLSAGAWRSAALMDLCNVGALLTSERDAARFPFAPAVYAGEHRFPPWIVYDTQCRPLPFGISVAPPILVVADPSQWERACGEWLRSVRDASPAALPQVPFLVWQPLVPGRGPVLPLESVRSVYVPSRIVDPTAALSAPALASYAGRGGIVATVERSDGSGRPPWATRIVRGVADLLPAMPLATAEAGRVTNVRQERGRHSAEVECLSPCLFYFKSSYYRGWRVRVDGREAANVAVAPGFNACRLEAGRHAVEFRYGGANGERLGFLLSGLAALAWPAGLLLARVRRRSGVQPSEDRHDADDAGGRLPAAQRLRLLAPCLVGLALLAGLNAKERILRCPVPTTPLTGDVLQGVDLVLTWNPLRDPNDAVQFQVSQDDRDFRETILDARGTGSWYAHPDKRLEPGRTYYWRMRSLHAGQPGPWTRAIRFSTSPDAR